MNVTHYYLRDNLQEEATYLKVLKDIREDVPDVPIKTSSPSSFDIEIEQLLNRNSSTERISQVESSEEQSHQFTTSALLRQSEKKHHNDKVLIQINIISSIFQLHIF